MNEKRRLLNGENIDDKRAGLRQGLTGRVVVISLLLVPLNAYWIVRIEIIPDMAHSTTLSLMFTAVYTLVFLAGANWILRAVVPRWAFSQSELLLTYSMVCVGSAMASHDFIAVLIPQFTWTFWMATPTNNWDTLINPHMPKWLTVQDPEVMRGFYQGGTSLYQSYILQAWLGPVAMWSIFIGLLVLVMLCLNSIVRRRWLDDEHLACPLVYLPVEISRPQRAIFINKLFWVGFAAAASIEIWNRMAFFHPVLPVIQVDPVNMAAGLTGRPWNAIGLLPRSFFPFLIGLGYLMPTDFVFSFWFFYLLWKGQRVLGAVAGLDQIQGFPFAGAQSFGAYLVFGVYALWLTRDYIKRVYKSVIGAGQRLTEEKEPLSYRVAVVGGLLGFAGLVWFSIAIGMSLWVSIVFFLTYYFIGLTITRMRVQFGVPIHSVGYSPVTMLTDVVGSRSLPRGDLVGIANYFWFNRAYRGHAMPHQMEAMKMQQDTTQCNRATVPALALAAMVGTVATFWAILHLYYQLGATAKGGMNMWVPENYKMLTSWLLAPQPPQWAHIASIGVGALFAFFLQAMRLRSVNWPFHPLAYAISGDYLSNFMWFPLFIAWLIKSCVVKYGSHLLYQRLVPVFLGLILGQFMVGGTINLVSLALDLRRPFCFFVP